MPNWKKLITSGSDASLSTLTINNSGSTADSLTITATEDSSTAAPVITLKRNSNSPADADYIGQIKFKGENDADQEVVYAKITGKISDASDGTEDGNIEFANRRGGLNVITARLSSDKLQLLNGTDLEVDGNAGIGTTTPAGKLDVNGKIVLSGDTEHFIEKNTTSLITAAAAETTTVAGRNVDLYAYDDVNLRAGTNDNVTIHTGGSETMRIDSSGNVGIGTTSPSDKLHVYGDLVVGGDGSDAILRFFETTNGWNIRHVASGNRLAMSNVLGGTDHFNITDTGNVGIGTDSPVSKLDVTNNLRITHSSGIQKLLLGNQDSAGVNNPGIIASANGILYFGGGSSWSTADGGTMDYTMTLLDNGNVGIGTDNPGVALDVVGEIRATGDITAYYSSDERLKENIKPIENATDKVKAIGGYTFDWKEGIEEVTSKTGKDVGIIAQELEKVLPELVNTRENGYKGVDYPKLVALLVESNKQLISRVEELENKL